MDARLEKYAARIQELKNHRLSRDETIQFMEDLLSDFVVELGMSVRVNAANVGGAHFQLVLNFHRDQ